MVKKAKTDCEDMVEERFQHGNEKDAWRGLNTMMGRKHKAAPYCDDPVRLSNRPYMFYSRFDYYDFSDDCDSVCTVMKPAPVALKKKSP